jgi:hypothetical protein
MLYKKSIVSYSTVLIHRYFYNLLQDTYNKAQRNYYIKYGDMPWFAMSKDVLMKQKHRMVWERRHGENTLEAKRERLAANDVASSDGE